MNTYTTNYSPDFHRLRFYGILASVLVLGFILFRSGMASASDHQALVLTQGFDILFQALKARLPALVVTYFFWIVVIGALLGYNLRDLFTQVRMRNNNDSISILVNELTLGSAFVLADVGLLVTKADFVIYFVVRLVVMFAVGIILAFIMNAPFYGILTGATFHKQMVNPGGDGLARTTGRAMVLAGIMTALFV